MHSQSPTDTKPDAALLQAYRDTAYCCIELNGQAEFELRIGVYQPALLPLYTVFRVDCAAFITACNPLSQRISDAENALRQQRLLADLRQRGYTGLRAEGRPLRPGWQPEASFLVPGLSLEASHETAARFQQHAFVWMGAACVPTLFLTAARTS